MLIRYVPVMALMLAACSCNAMAAGAQPAPAGRAATGPAASPLQPLIDWFERAHREYQDVVIKELSVPTGRPPELPQGPAQIARGRAPALLDRLRGWLGFGPSDAPGPALASKAPAGAISEADKAELSARIARQIEAREDEKRQAAAKQRLAESVRAAELALRKATEARLAEAQKGASPVPSGPPSRTGAAEPPTAAEAQARPVAEPKVAVAEPQPTPKFETRPFTAPAQSPGPQTAVGVGPLRPASRPALAAEPPPAIIPASSSAEASLPAHWNRIPRSLGKPAPASEVAQRFAEGVSNAADKLFQAAAAEPKKADASPSSRPRGCSRAGRTVEPPAKYKVKKGDTLWAIARRYYDSGVKYMRIVRANEDRISDPDLIYPCQKIFLPRRHAWLLLGLGWDAPA